MAATDFLWTRFPISGADVPVKNTSGAAISANQLVKLDSANPASATQSAPGVVLTSAVADFPFAVAVENIPIGGQGRVQLEGIAVCIAAGAIAAAAIVGPSAATPGDVTTYTAANPSLGQGMTVAAALADPILVRLAPSKNA